jgi:hypothetical protein
MIFLSKNASKAIADAYKECVNSGSSFIEAIFFLDPQSILPQSDYDSAKNFILSIEGEMFSPKNKS